MNFLTTAEYAKIWNISQRRVAIYCKEGRIDGAVLKGKTWLIPENKKTGGSATSTEKRTVKLR